MGGGRQTNAVGDTIKLQLGFDAVDLDSGNFRM